MPLDFANFSSFFSHLANAAWQICVMIVSMCLLITKFFYKWFGGL